MTPRLLRAPDRSERPTPLAVTLGAGVVGFTANALLQWHCPNGHAAHLLLEHAAIAVTFALLGAAWSWRAR